MNRTEKETEVQALKKDLSTAKIALITRFTGITGTPITQLRLDLRKKGAKYKVVKNTLARRAIQGTAFEALKDFFKLPVGLVYTKDDPVSPAKVLKEFGKDETIPFSIVTGCMDGKLLSPKDISALADLPSREEMIAKLMGSMLAPAQNMVNVMAAVPRQLATVLAAIRDKKQQ